ncbi:MAG: hypothetical protein WC852_06315 [Candidatus Nanoarchaeia archaeon]|jgi:hypothetical protein
MGKKLLAMGATLAALVLGCGSQKAYDVPVQQCVEIPSCGSVCYDNMIPESREDYKVFVLSNINGGIERLYMGESIQVGKCLMKLVEGDDSRITLTQCPGL